MERPSGPLPPPPISSSPIDNLETIAKSLEDIVLSNTSPPPPAVQPNESNVETSFKPTSSRTSVIEVSETSKVPPACVTKQSSLTSSTESVLAGSPLFHADETVYSMNPIDYKIGPAIGFGSSAIVYHAMYVPLGMAVAVKMIDLDHFERNQIDELRREIQVMTLCKHSNLLRVLVSFVHESKLWIVTPYLSGGSCLDIMKTGFRDGLEESVIATILQQALQGLEYLHRNGHIHRDFKAGNLLMDRDGTVQLADFGVSSCLSEDVDRRGMRKTFVGTPCWMAPEVMEMTRGYDCKADIWSFGITCLELAYGHAPFSKYPPMKVIYLTLSSAPRTLDRKRSKYKYSKTFKEMIDMCLQRDPIRRPTAEMLLKHSFFKVAKKRAHLVNEILEKIPPLEERPRVKRLMKQIIRQQEQQPSMDNEEWNFSSSDNDDNASTAPTSPTQGLVQEQSHGAAIARCSRFVVEADSTKRSPIEEASTAQEMEIGKGTRVDVVVAVPADLNDAVAEEEESGIRKGRFSVLESATGETSTSPPASSDADKLVSKGPSPPPPEDSEEGRRSRFQVETATGQTPSAATAAGTTMLEKERSSAHGSPLAPQSRFEVSHAAAAGSSAADMIPPVSYHPHATQVGPMPEDMLGINEDYYGSGMVRDYGRPTSHGSLIFVHPSQFDQLLLLNELMRQQLLELRNSSTYCSSVSYNHAGSSSFHPTIHPGHFGSRAGGYWDRDGFENGPMTEDPRVVFPPPLAAYSPNLYDQSRPLNSPSYSMKRRSFSIDNRHVATSAGHAGHTTQAPRSYVDSANTPSSTHHHRSVHSLKSPTYNPVTIDVEQLKRELEALRRENTELRKHT